MNEEEFLKGVHMKIGILECERRALEMIQEKQKRYFYKKMRACLLLFSAILVFILCAVLFQINMGLIALGSIIFLLVTVWIETADYEAKNMEMGVNQNGYSY